MYREYFYKIGLALYGAVAIALGIIILAQGEVLLHPAAVIGGIAIGAHGIHSLINFFSRGGKHDVSYRKTTLFAGIFNVVSGTLIIALPMLTTYLLYFAFTVYVLINAAVKLIDYLIYKKNNIHGRLYDLAAFVFFFTFGIVMAFVPGMNERGFLLVAGIYCIVYGGCVLYDFITQILPIRAKNVLKRRIRVSMPVFISTFMPLWFLREINELAMEEKPLPMPSVIDKNADLSRPPDMEVLIHVSNEGVGKMGHCDLYIDGEILSYGNYCLETQSMFGLLGEGVMFTSDRQTHLDFSVDFDKHTMFVYGLRLTDEQMKRVREAVAELKSVAYEWKPPYQVAKEQDPDANIEDFNDYGSKLWNGTHCTCYKFSEGRFKTYFVLSTNCVLLADHILGKAGSDIVKINGIITPGSYFDYLQREWLISDSMVISRNVYDRNSYEKSKAEAKRKSNNANG